MYSFPTNEDHLSLLTVCFLISLQCNSILLTLCPLHNSFIYPNVSLYIYYMQLKFHACFASQHLLDPITSIRLLRSDSGVRRHPGILEPTWPGQHS